MSNRVAIREKCDLPCGKIYKDMPDTITLRAMTTIEEKMRLAGSGSGSGISTFANLIKACTVEPEDFDVNRLKIIDLHYLLYRLRVVTYGKNYNYSIVCPRCGNTTDVVVDIDKIPVVNIEDDFTDSFTIGPLPVCGDKLTCRVLTVQDMLDIEKESRRILSRSPEYVGNPTFTLERQCKIREINGEEQVPFKTQKYIDEMNAADLAYFDQKYDEMISKYGLDINMFDICPKCNGEINYTLAVTGEFFRPTY